MGSFFKKLSFTTCWEFVNCIISTAPICLWLALPSFKRNWKTFLSNPAVRLFCVFIIMDLGVKFCRTVNHGYSERRYMLPFLCVLIIFGADGLLNSFVPFFHRYLRERFPFLTLRNIAIGLISILFIADFALVIFPSLDHPWFESIRTVVAQECPKDKKPVILSNYSDSRLGYYANSELFVFSTKDFKLTNNVYIYRKKWSTDELIKNKPSGINHFTGTVKKLGGNNVFIFLYNMKDSDFRKLFEEKNLKFPFKLLKGYNGRHGEHLCFYQFEEN